MYLRTDALCEDSDLPLDSQAFMISSIMKTCLYNVDTLKPYFYIVKLGFTGVYTIFLMSAQ